MPLPAARVRAYKKAHPPTPCLSAANRRHTMVTRTRAGQQVGSKVTRAVRLVEELLPLPLPLQLPMCQGLALTRVQTLPRGLALTRAWALGAQRHSRLPS